MNNQTPTLDQLIQAHKIVKDYAACDAPNCHKVALKADLKETIMWGIVKHWCPTCYEKWAKD